MYINTKLKTDFGLITLNLIQWLYLAGDQVQFRNRRIFFIFKLVEDNLFHV